MVMVGSATPLHPAPPLTQVLGGYEEKDLFSTCLDSDTLFRHDFEDDLQAWLGKANAGMT